MQNPFYCIVYLILDNCDDISFKLAATHNKSFIHSVVTANQHITEFNQTDGTCLSSWAMQASGWWCSSAMVTILAYILVQSSVEQTSFSQITLNHLIYSIINERDRIQQRTIVFKLTNIYSVTEKQSILLTAQLMVCAYQQFTNKTDFF